MSEGKDSLCGTRNKLNTTDEGVIKLEGKKVLIFGPVGSGKTATIRTLSDTFSVNNYHVLNDQTITVDYGLLNPEGSEPLSLLASYGQDYSKSYWSCLEDELIGVILLIDNRRKDPLYDLENFLSVLLVEERKHLLATKVVIGVTHVDISRTPSINDFRKVLEKQSIFKEHTPPLFSVDARSHQQMSMLLQALLYSQDPFINTASETGEITSIQS